MPKCSYCGRENQEIQGACYECGTELAAIACPLVSRRRRRASWLYLVAVFLLLVGYGAHVLEVNSEPIVCDHMTIEGSREFKSHVVAALTMLRTRSPRAYEIVTNEIGIFVQSKHSGMAASEKPPVSYLHDQVSWESTEAFAAGIAHESFHSKLYHDFLKTNSALLEIAGHIDVPDVVWGNEPGEKLCCEHQLQVLKELGAPPEELAACAWNPSNRYWEVPIWERNW